VVRCSAVVRCGENLLYSVFLALLADPWVYPRLV